MAGVKTTSSATMSLSILFRTGGAGAVVPWGVARNCSIEALAADDGLALVGDVPVLGNITPLHAVSASRAPLCVRSF